MYECVAYYFKNALIHVTMGLPQTLGGREHGWSQTRAVLPLTVRLMGQDTVSWAERNIKMSSMILPAFLMVFDHCAELPLFYNGTIESSRVSKDLLSPLPGLNS